MGNYHNFIFNYNISSTKELPEGFPANALKVSISQNSKALANRGCIMEVGVRPAYTITREGEEPPEIEPIVCKALLDTGAHTSAISYRIMEQLGLISVGTTDVVGATGHAAAQVSDVVFSFPGSGLTERQARVHALKLYALELNEPADVLIGRDVMSAWNIVWNGPTSTVLIFD